MRAAALQRFFAQQLEDARRRSWQRKSTTTSGRCTSSPPPSASRQVKSESCTSWSKSRGRRWISATTTGPTRDGWRRPCGPGRARVSCGARVSVRTCGRPVHVCLVEEARRRSELALAGTSRRGERKLGGGSCRHREVVVGGVVGEAANLAVAEAVVAEGQDLASDCDSRDLAAAAFGDSFALGAQRPAAGGYVLAASVSAQRRMVEPWREMCPIRLLIEVCEVHVNAGVLEQLREPPPAVGRLQRDVRALRAPERLCERLSAGRDPLLQRHRDLRRAGADQC